MELQLAVLASITELLGIRFNISSSDSYTIIDENMVHTCEKETCQINEGSPACVTFVKPFVTKL